MPSVALACRREIGDSGWLERSELAEKEVEILTGGRTPGQDPPRMPSAQCTPGRGHGVDRRLTLTKRRLRLSLSPAEREIGR